MSYTVIARAIASEVWFRQESKSSESIETALLFGARQLFAS